MSLLVIHDDGLNITPNLGPLPVCASGSFRAALEFRVSYPGEVKVEIQYSIAKSKKTHFIIDRGKMVKHLEDSAAVSQRPSRIKKDIQLCLSGPIQEERAIITLVVRVVGQDTSRRSRCSFFHLSR